MTLDPAIVSDRSAAVWPGVVVQAETLASYLIARPEAELAHAPDLYLACGCLAKNPKAIAVFHEHFLGRIGAYLGSLARRPEVSVDEIRQELAMKLLIGDEGSPPRLAGYAGRGPLDGWIRIAATRLALDAARRGPRDRPGSDAEDADRLAEAASCDMDGELKSLRDRYRAEFARSLEEALVGLAATHRALLRLHYLDGTTTAALAALYKVSRNTIVRRIADARSALLESTIERFAARVGIPPDRYQSLLSMLRSQLEVSVARLLADDPALSPNGATR